MKSFTVDRDELARAMGLVMPIVPKSETLPVLQSVQLECAGGVLTISATNLDQSVQVRVPVAAEEPGSLLVPGKILRDLVKELPAGGVKFEYGLAETVKVSCGHGEYDLAAMPWEAFPAMPPVDWSAEATLIARDIAALTARTAFAASTDEERPVMNGVLVQLRVGFLRFVATDGHTLARATLDIDGLEDVADWIVPTKALAVIAKCFAPGDVLTIGISENHIGFGTADARVFTRVVEGPYPDYAKVIPIRNDKSITVSRDRFSAMLRRVETVADEKTKGVILDVSPDMIRVECNGDLFGGKEEFAVVYDGEPFTIGFRSEFLLNALDRIPTEEARLTFKSNSTAATVEPVEWNAPGTYLVVVMPLRIVGDRRLAPVEEAAGV